LILFISPLLLKLKICLGREGLGEFLDAFFKLPFVPSSSQEGIFGFSLIPFISPLLLKLKIRPGREGLGEFFDAFFKLPFVPSSSQEGIFGFFLDTFYLPSFVKEGLGGVHKCFQT